MLPRRPYFTSRISSMMPIDLTPSISRYDGVLSSAAFRYIGSLRCPFSSPITCPRLPCSVTRPAGYPDTDRQTQRPASSGTYQCRKGIGAHLSLSLHNSLLLSLPLPWVPLDATALRQINAHLTQEVDRLSKRVKQLVTLSLSPLSPLSQFVYLIIRVIFFFHTKLLQEAENKQRLDDINALLKQNEQRILAPSTPAPISEQPSTANSLLLYCIFCFCCSRKLD